MNTTNKIKYNEMGIPIFEKNYNNMTDEEIRKMIADIKVQKRKLGQLN